MGFHSRERSFRNGVRIGEKAKAHARVSAGVSRRINKIYESFVDRKITGCLVEYSAVRFRDRFEE